MKIFFTYAWQFIAYAVSYVAITWAMNALFCTSACPPALSERLLKGVFFAIFMTAINIVEFCFRRYRDKRRRQIRAEYDEIQDRKKQTYNN